MSQPLEEFDAFRSGLSKDGVLAALQRDPDTGLRYLTYHESPLNSNGMVELFTPSYSSDCTRKQLELKISDVQAACNDDDAVALRNLEPAKVNTNTRVGVA